MVNLMVKWYLKPILVKWYLKPYGKMVRGIGSRSVPPPAGCIQICTKFKPNVMWY
eukprot:SAG11_NODE_10937_length_795_cov_0.778736_1_plen_55_part_00